MIDKHTPELLKEKLARALKAKAVLAERSRQLRQQIEDFRSREEVMNHLASELLERQRELNFMLHRASSVLHQLQDTNLALSAEFTQLMKELPAPKGADWEATVARVNDLFKKTHELASEMQDEIFGKTAVPDPPGLQVHDDTKNPAASDSLSASTSQTDAPDPEPIQRSESEPCEIRGADAQASDETPDEAEAAKTGFEEATTCAPDGPQQQEPVESELTEKQSDDEAPKGVRKPGLLSRLFGRRKKDASGIF